MRSKIPALISMALFLAAACLAQVNSVKPNAGPKSVGSADVQAIRSSAAYAELLLHKADLDSNLNALLVDYTEDFPKVKDIRLELGFLKIEMDRLLAVKPSDTSKLSEALGKLMLKKVELETELDMLRVQYKDDHPDVKKTRKKIDTYESAIKEILG
jgi:hypothetical protein